MKKPTLTLVAAPEPPPDKPTEKPSFVFKAENLNQITAWMSQNGWGIELHSFGKWKCAIKRLWPIEVWRNSKDPRTRLSVHTSYVHPDPWTAFDAAWSEMQERIEVFNAAVRAGEVPSYGEAKTTAQPEPTFPELKLVK